eukprot:jgi/Mesen1/4494/ME000229S03511
MAQPQGTPLDKEAVFMMAQQEMEYRVGLFNGSKDPDLNVGENSCIDRCVSKYWQVTGIVGQMLGANKPGIEAQLAEVAVEVAAEVAAEVRGWSLIWFLGVGSFYDTRKFFYACVPPYEIGAATLGLSFKFGFKRGVGCNDRA